MGAKLSTPASAFAIPHNAAMNVTPFVDIMLVLLIIFMVSMPIAVRTHRLEIPPPQAGVPAAPPTIVSLQRDGSLFVGEQRTDFAHLGAAVTGVLGARKTERVYLRAERGVRYADFMRLMNTLKSAGHAKLAIVSEEL